MASLNQVVLIGNLTDDPELNYTESGVARANFTIAMNRRYTDANDEVQEETTFVPITVWRGQAENCEEYLEKGDAAAVVGRLNISSYEDDDGNDRTWVSIVAQDVQFLSFLQDNGGGSGGGGGQGSGGSGDDEEIPF